MTEEISLEQESTPSRKKLTQFGREVIKERILTCATTSRALRSTEHETLSAYRHNAIECKKMGDDKVDESVLTAFTRLHWARKFMVGREARTYFLAYGFLNGLDYHEIEKKCRVRPNLHAVELTVISLFDFNETTSFIFDELSSWLDSAEDYLAESGWIRPGTPKKTAES